MPVLCDIYMHMKSYMINVSRRNGTLFGRNSSSYSVDTLQHFATCSHVRKLNLCSTYMAYLISVYSRTVLHCLYSVVAPRGLPACILFTTLQTLSACILFTALQILSTCILFAAPQTLSACILFTALQTLSACILSTALQTLSACILFVALQILCAYILFVALQILCAWILFAVVHTCVPVFCFSVANGGVARRSLSFHGVIWRHFISSDPLRVQQPAFPQGHRFPGGDKVLFFGLTFSHWPTTALDRAQ